MRNILWAIFCLALLNSCSSSEDNPQPTPPTGPNLNANPSDDAHPFVTDYAIPHLNAANEYVEHTVSYREQEILNYALEWVEEKRHTAWVAFSFDSETSRKNVNRTDEWLPDPFVPSSPQESDHKSDGFDKGRQRTNLLLHQPQPADDLLQRRLLGDFREAGADLGTLRAV